MISKENAKRLAIGFLEDNNISYSSLDEQVFEEIQKKILYGKKSGKIKNTYIISFGQLWGLEERTIFLCLDSETGEVLYVLGPHGLIYIDEE